MKKFLVFTLTGLLHVGLISCCKTSVDNSSSSAVDSTESKSSYSSDENTNSKIDDLESEIDRLNTLLSSANEEFESEIENLNSQLSAAEEEKNNLLDQITDLEEKIKEFESIKSFSKTWLKGSTYLIWQERNTSPFVTLSMEYPDKTVVEIINIHYIWTLRVSPNETKIIFNDFEGESVTHVYMYDIEKRETRELSITDIPQDRTVSSMEWLDDRYFLFVVMSDHGTVVRGGDIYVYDTQTDEYKVIIKSEDNWQLQASDFNVFMDEFVIVNCWMQGENGADLTIRKHYLLTYDEIYDLIENNKIIDLSKRDSMME